jgi:hypothetical protein
MAPFVKGQGGRKIRDLGARDAYYAALERDTLEGYEEFVAAYPNDPMAKRPSSPRGVRQSFGARHMQPINRRHFGRTSTGTRTVLTLLMLGAA